MYILQGSICMEATNQYAYMLIISVITVKMKIKNEDHGSFAQNLKNLNQCPQSWLSC